MRMTRSEVITCYDVIPDVAWVMGQGARSKPLPVLLPNLMKNTVRFNIYDCFSPPLVVNPFS